MQGQQNIELLYFTWGVLLVNVVNVTAWFVRIAVMAASDGLLSQHGHKGNESASGYGREDATTNQARAPTKELQIHNLTKLK